MAGAQLSPDLASLCYILPFGQIRRTRPPSLVPKPSLRLGFRARRYLRYRRGSGVQLLRQRPSSPPAVAVHDVPMFINDTGLRQRGRRHRHVAVATTMMETSTRSSGDDDDGDIDTGQRQRR